MLLATGEETDEIVLIHSRRAERLLKTAVVGWQVSPWAMRENHKRNPERGYGEDLTPASLTVLHYTLLEFSASPPLESVLSSSFHLFHFPHAEALQRATIIGISLAALKMCPSTGIHGLF